MADVALPMDRRSAGITVFALAIALTLSSSVQAQTPAVDQGAAERVDSRAAYSSVISVTGDLRVATATTPINLKDAIALALEKNPVRKAALADQKIAAADLREAKSALLPRLVFSESATRGNDPVYAFGSRLQQGRFTAADFALNRLNNPLPLGNFATKFSGRWNLFNVPDWLNVRQVRLMKEAAAQQLQRTDQQVVLKVVSAYHDLLLATKQEQLAEQQVQTSEAILKLSRARFDSGLVVESDLLAAQVDDAVRRQELIRARNGVALAQAQLGAAIGLPASIAYQAQEISADKAGDLIDMPEAERRALASRPDLKEIEKRQAAAQTGTRMAKSALAPRLGAFATWEQDNPAVFAGGSNHWIGGVELQVDLFTGGQKSSQVQRARALEEKAAALHQSADNEVRLEVRKAWYDADSARQQLEVARTAIQQSDESLRITQTRYAAGLTTITEVLRSEESKRRAQTDYWQAAYGFRIALANLEFAMGTLSNDSPAVQ